MTNEDRLDKAKKFDYKECPDKLSAIGCLNEIRLELIAEVEELRVNTGTVCLEPIKHQSLQSELDGMWEIRRKDGVVSQERANEIQSLQAELERERNTKKDAVALKLKYQAELEQVKGERDRHERNDKKRMELMEKQAKDWDVLDDACSKLKAENAELKQKCTLYLIDADEELKEQISDLKQKLEASEKRCEGYEKK